MSNVNNDPKESLQKEVQTRYGAIAASVGKSGCAPGASPERAQRVEGGGGCCGGGADPISSGLYRDSETASLPADAVSASLGCGNPTALLALELGQTVLDLGSGGGID